MDRGCLSCLEQHVIEGDNPVCGASSQVMYCRLAGVGVYYYTCNWMMQPEIGPSMENVD